MRALARRDRRRRPHPGRRRGRARCRPASCARTRSRSPSRSPSSSSSSWRSADADDACSSCFRSSARSSSGGLPLPREATAALALLVALAEVGALDRRRSAASTSTSPACRLAPSASGSATSASPTPSASTASRSGSPGSPSSSAPPRSATAPGSDASAPRAYYGLMLFLIGAVVGVFAAQDLLLFYVFFEAMLIPLYVLVGVWGGPSRVSATRHVRHLHDGRLAADARLDRRLRALAGHVQPDRRRARATTTGSSSASPSPSRSRRRSSRSTAGCRDAYREAPPEVAARALRRRLEDGRLRLPPDRAPEVPGARPTTGARVDPRARRRRARLRLAARVPRAGPPRRDRVLVDGARWA